jgi:hypothetical protein
MEKTIREYTGNGEVITMRGAIRVAYYIREYHCDGRGGFSGRITNVEGHSSFHPIVPLSPDPYTLVMEDGRKLGVIVQDESGSLKGTGYFFND